MLPIQYVIQIIRNFVQVENPGVLGLGGLGRSIYDYSYIAFKGYLCYKKIISQNVPSQAQVKDFFV